VSLKLKQAKFYVMGRKESEDEIIDRAAEKVAKAWKKREQRPLTPYHNAKGPLA